MADDQPAGAEIDSALHDLGDERPAVRADAVRTLRRLGPEALSSEAALVAALAHDESPEVRAEAALALARLGTVRPETLAALTKALGDRDPEVRHWAEVALRDLAPKEQLPWPPRVSVGGGMSVEPMPLTDLYPRYVADPRLPRFSAMGLSYMKSEIPDGGLDRLQFSFGGRYGIIRLAPTRTKRSEPSSTSRAGSSSSSTRTARSTPTAGTASTASASR
jgi:hypothetical protein